MDTAQQIADIKAKSTPYVTVTMQQAQGGWIVNAQTQWQDNVTKGVTLSENAQCVTTTAEQAAQNSLNYSRTGTFDVAQSAAHEYGATPGTI